MIDFEIKDHLALAFNHGLNLIVKLTDLVMAIFL